MLDQLFDGLDSDVHVPAADTTDYSAMPRAELKTLLFNQLIRQAMAPSPQPSILTLAIKMVGVEGAEAADGLEELTTAELVEKIRRMG
jgi:hypothetical protein